MTDFHRLLSDLTQSRVEFVIVGGFAATAHGSAFLTVDLDLVYRRSMDNMARLTAALRPFHPYLRGAPRGLPFTFDVEAMRRGLNFTLTTTAGDLDLLGEVVGGGTYEALLPHTELRTVLELECRFVDLETLIRLKRAAGRPKDLERLAELELLWREQHGREPGDRAR
jgi:hypothetical protein